MKTSSIDFNYLLWYTFLNENHSHLSVLLHDYPRRFGNEFYPIRKYTEII